MDDIYRDKILDHYHSPRNKGRLEKPDISYEEDNPLCGDRIRLDISLDSNDRVLDVAWEGDGCAISMASASLLSEKIKGESLDDLQSLGKDDILEMLGIELGPVRIKCALLSLQVLKKGAFGLSVWSESEE